MVGKTPSQKKMNPLRQKWKLYLGLGERTNHSAKTEKITEQLLPPAVL